MGPIEWMEKLSNSQGAPYNCIGMLVRPVLRVDNTTTDINDYTHLPSFTVVLLNRDEVKQQQERGYGRFEAVAIQGDTATGILLQSHEYRVIWDDGKFV